MRKITMKVEPRMLGRFEQRYFSAFRGNRIRGALRAAGRDITEHLRARSEPVSDMGAYRMGWYAKVGKDYLLVGNAASHAIYVEMGRAAGGRMPPHTPILMWVLRKGMQANAAWPVGRAIAKRGITARPLFMLESTQDTMAKMVQKRMVGFLDKVITEAAR